MYPVISMRDGIGMKRLIVEKLSGFTKKTHPVHV